MLLFPSSLANTGKILSLTIPLITSLSLLDIMPAIPLSALNVPNVTLSALIIPTAPLILIMLSTAYLKSTLLMYILPVFSILNNVYPSVSILSNSCISEPVILTRSMLLTCISIFPSRVRLTIDRFATVPLISGLVAPPFNTILVLYLSKPNRLTPSFIVIGCVR